MTRETFSYNHQGKELEGQLVIENGMLTVSTQFGQKTLELGNSPPTLMARMVARDLARGRDKIGP